MTRPVLVIILATALLTGTVACASPTPVDPGGPDATTWPEGREFWSTSITEDGTPKTLVAGTKLTVRFGKPGELRVYAGCNHLGIQANLEGDRIKPYDYMATMIGCLDGRADQDVWMQDFFAAGPSWTVSGDELRLSTEHTEIRLTDKEVLDPDRPLAGPHWVVDSILSTKSVSSALRNSASLDFATDGTFSGRTGCATLTGTYQAQAGQLTVASIKRVEHPCEGSMVDLASALDRAVMATLQGTVKYEIGGPRLTIEAPDGNGLLLSADA
jgi:heat shock protein HslJ